MEELEILVTKNCELSIELEKKNKEYSAMEKKFNDLEFSKIAVDNELKESKKSNDELVKRVVGLVLEKIDVEKRAERRIFCLEEQIRDLENGKSRAENETEIWKKRCRELETQVLSLRCPESGGVVGISDREDEKEISRKHTCEIGGKQSPNVSTGIKIERCSDDVKDPTCKKCSKGTFSDQRGEEYECDVRCEPGNIPSAFTPKRKRCHKTVMTDSESDEDDKIPIGKLIKMKMEQQTGISRRKLTPLSPCTRDVAVSSEANNVQESVTLSRRRLLSQGTDDEYEYDVRCEPGNIPSSFTPKRKRSRKTVMTDSESDEDDKIPIGKLKMMKMEQRDVAVSSEAHNVQESVTPSRRRLLSQRQCEEKKSRVDDCESSESGDSSCESSESGDSSCESSDNEEPATPLGRRLLSQRQCEEKKSRVDETSCYENMSLDNVRTGASSQENFTAERDEELGAEETGSESEGDSLGGFIVPDDEISDGESSGRVPSSSVSEDTRDSERKTEWQLEGDMLSSFARDPIVCMKAVCALYRQQTAEEKAIKGTLHLNKRGFSQPHAPRGTQLAEFLSEGSEEDDLVKSVEELEMFDPKGLEDCWKFARHYSKQLFTIYENEEDPLFGPP